MEVRLPGRLGRFELHRALAAMPQWSALLVRRPDGELCELRIVEPGTNAESAADSARLLRHWMLLHVVEHPSLRRVWEVDSHHEPPFVLLEPVNESSRGAAVSSLSGGPGNQSDRLLSALAELHRCGLVVGELDQSDLVQRVNGDWLLDVTTPATAQDSGDADPASDVAALSRLLLDDLDRDAAGPPSVREPNSDQAGRQATPDPCVAGTAATESQLATWRLLLQRGLDPDLRLRPAAAELASLLAECGNKSASATVPDVDASRIAMTMHSRIHDANVGTLAIPGDRELTGIDEPVPDVLGRFQIKERLGAGAMGVVYRGVDPVDGRDVAIKVLNDRIARDSEVLRRFSREARLLARAGNAFVAALLDANLDAGRHFLAIEFVPGGTLSAAINSVSRCRERDALRIIRDITRGLAVAHREGIVHRDIKPDNVLLTAAGRALFDAAREPVSPSQTFEADEERLNPAAKATQLTATGSGLPLAKLSDFGLARTALPTESLALTQDGAILGTPLYMSPEQCRGESADARSDVYSIGATWFHLLTGRPPFTGANHIEVMNHHCQSPLPSLKQLCPELSDGVIAAVEKCLAKNPDARYADASGLRDDLDRMLLGEAASIVLHPAAPSAGPEVLQFQLECELRSSPARLWPYVSHTDRVNHALGLPAVRYTTRRDPVRGVERFAEARLAGQTLRWQEHPYEWIEGRRLSVLREFSTGPFLWFMNVVELLPASGGGTRLTQTFRVVPRNWLGRLIARFELGRRSPRNFGRLYRRIDGYLQSHGSAPAEVDAFGVTHVMTAAGRSRLRERLDRLSGAQVDPAAMETLRQYLEHASDLEVARIRPLVFAERFGLVPQNVVTLFLLAAREGVLTLLWDILCPSCRIPADVQETLASLKDHAYCPSCDVKYEVDFANSVEMIFRVHPEIRSTETRTYCIGGPAFSAHVVAQVRLAEGERFDLELALTEGAYRLRGAALPFAVELRVASSGTASRLDLSLRRPPLPVMVPVLRAGAQVITLLNDTASPLQIRVERTAGRSQAVTAAAAAAIPLFRQMFPKEVLAPGQIVSVTSTTLLLAELCATRALYETLGDGRAFELIRGRLQQLDDQVRAAGGAVVKFVGDGLLANFSDSSAAFQCALAMLNTLPAGSEAPAVRLALHRGPALVTTINDRLDYFGETVHTARQLLDAAPAGAMLWAASSASREAVLELAGGIPLQVEPLGFVVPQLMRFVFLGRIAAVTE